MLTISHPIPLIRATLDVSPYHRLELKEAIAQLANDPATTDLYVDDRVALASVHSDETLATYALTSTFDIDHWALPTFADPLFPKDHFFSQALERATFLDAGEPLTSGVREVGLDLSLDEAIRLLGNPHRRLPVLVVTQPVPALIDELLPRVAGFAHLLLVPPEATYGIADHFPKVRAFNGTVRIYRPGLKAEDPAAAHPRWFPELKRESIVEIMRAVLLSQRPSSAMLDIHVLREQYAPARQYRDAQEALDAALTDVSELRRDLERQRGDTTAALQLLALTERERDELRTELQQGSAPAPVVGPLIESALPPQEQASELQAYLDLYYPERFLVSESAVESYEAARTFDRSLLASALELLGTDYYAELHALPGAKTRFERRLQELHLRIGGGRNRFEVRAGPNAYTIDRYLRTETSRKSGRQVAIYFTYDADVARIVVGHLPSPITK